MKRNPRYELRAYESADACRLASIILGLMAGAAGRTRFTRDEVAAVWAKRYPRHAAQSGSRSIRSRIGKFLSTFKVAGMVQVNGDDITVVNPARVAMSARNLAIVEDSQGMAKEPADWERRPEAPEHLHAVQAPLEVSRLEARTAKHKV